MNRQDIIEGGEYLCRLQDRSERVCKILKVGRPAEQRQRRYIRVLNWRTNREVMLSSEAQVLFLVERTGVPGQWRRPRQ